MDDELNLDLDQIEQNAEQNVKVKNRFQQLSEDKHNLIREKEELEAKLKEASDAKIQSEKERDFHKEFASNVTKYPNASEFQDKILEKVRGGYSTEDAMISVLAKEGKLTPAQPTMPQAEGGSSPNTMEGAREINDLKPDEKLEQLKELDKSGDLARAILGR